MLFDSTAYVVFLILVGLVYWRLPFRKQNFFLLAASYFFYGWWDWRFLFLMGSSTLVNFTVSRRIDASTGEQKRKALLIFSLIINFAFLGFFKYFEFFLDSFIQLAAVLGLANIPLIVWKIVLPPAISFYTFQEVAYIVDVYQRKIRSADRVVDYALFVSLFPHLIAGPIQQPSHLLPQVQKARLWNPDKAFDGLMLILEGIFRKVVIADNCALIANAAFGGGLGPPSVWVVLLGVYAFAWQIYGDFSGYSCVARGSAQVLGFHFMINFRQPYLAETLQDFWRRWHISLSSWLRDYLYIPLGGSRLGSVRTYANLTITMLLGGLWHGANWTFVVWGGIHGAGLAMERLSGLVGSHVFRSILGRWIRRVIIFHFVCFAWIFFRSPSFGMAWGFLAGLGDWQWKSVYGLALLFLMAHVIVLLFIDVHLEHSGGEYLLEKRPLIARVTCGLLLCVFITLFGANQTNAFIYFQF